MFTGVFKDRSARIARESSRDLAVAEQALAELLGSRELRGYTLSRHCELGPFLVDYLFIERSLIVELAPEVGPSPITARHAARLKFFNDMGYVVWGVSPRELLRHPDRVLARLRTTLEG